MASPRVPILLVDDRRANLLALEALLDSPQYELVSVTTGAEALAELERRDFGVILLDLQMPTMDGIETALLMRRRAAPLGHRAPIIFVTAIDIDRDRILRAYATGAVDFIQKPLEPAILAAKVAVFADLHRARRLARERAEEVESERRVGHEQAQRFRLLVESVQDYAIFMLDPVGLVTSWNLGAERINGYTAAEIVGKHFSVFYPPEVAAQGKCEHELDLATREGRFEEEGWRVRKDGSRLWANVTITSLRGPDGALVGFAKVTRDLTVRRRNEEGLRLLAAKNAALEARAAAEQAERARREFLAKAGATLASSLDYRATLATIARLAVPELADWCSIALVEPGAHAPVQVALEHVDPDKLQHARDLAQKYPPDPNAQTGVPQVVRSGTSELYSEVPAALLEAAARDGEHLRLLRELQLESAIVVPLPGRDRVLGAMTFIYAGSGRRYTEADLAFAEDFARRAAMAIENGQAHAAVTALLDFQERFVAVLGHDLRNPLSSINMAAGVLRQRAVNADDTATVRVLDRMKSSSMRMSRMIEQILDLTRSRLGGGLELRAGPMDLRESLTAIVDELRDARPSCTIDLRCPSLHGAWDRDRLDQVFSNLIANALDYGLDGKPVDVDAQLRDDGSVQVIVHNEGEPIPPDLLSQLFNPFRRGSRDSRATKTAGLGLGLYISREIVRAHGGELDVTSSSADGTAFRVILPPASVTSSPQFTR